MSIPDPIKAKMALQKSIKGRKSKKSLNDSLKNKELITETERPFNGVETSRPILADFKTEE